MDRHAETRQIWVIRLILALGTLAVFAQVIHHDFINYDDPDYVTNNSHVQSGLTLDGLNWAFTTAHACNWHPLTWLSHMADCQLYDLHPGGHHFTSLLFHIANVLLLFGVLRRMTGAVWRSAIVAALFAWHPLHIESVAWISERKDVLSAFFWLLTMDAYLRYVKRPGRGRYLLTLFFFALGLLSKPMIVTLPFVLLLMDFWPLKRIAFATMPTAPADDRDAVATPALHPLPPWRLVWEKTPFFALSAVSCAVTYLIQKNAGAVATLHALTPAQRAGTALVAYARYLRKMMWPDDLAIYYPLHGAWTTAKVAEASILLSCLTIVVMVQMRRRPYLLMGWLWYLGTLVPVIGLVQVGSQSMADRYTYLPLIGIFIMLVWAGTELAEHSPAAQKIMAAATACVLAACLAATGYQLRYWRDDLTLFNHALDVTTDNAIAHNNLGLALDNLGQTNNALIHFKEALRIQPNSDVVLYDIGLLYAREGDLKTAFDYYQRALRIRPGYSDAHYNLGNLFASQNNLPDAARQYEASVQSEPDSADAHNNLGAVLARLGYFDQAMIEFKAALRIKPNYPEAQYQLGGVLQKTGHLEEASSHFAEALRLKPDFFPAQLKLGLALAELAQFQDAEAQLLKAVQLEPTNAIAYFNLAGVYAAEGNLDQAADGFNEAIRFDPDDPEAHFRLAQVLTAAGKFEPAIAQYREAIRLRPDFTEALNRLAVVLAINSSPAIRNGAEAVQLAGRACDLTGRTNAAYLSTLDASYAEAGQFADAIKTAQRVIELSSTNQPDLAQKAEQRLELYRAGRAYHQ